MYTEYYNLTELPFGVTPNPKFLYMTDQHRTALNHLLFGIAQGKGFILLTGEVGTGKTTLCRKLLGSLGEQYDTALILNPMLSQTQLLRAIICEFGIEQSCRDRLEAMSLLNTYLLELNSAGREAVVIIDEAQDMSTPVLEMTRLLSNLETDSHKLLQIVLAGQPELRQKLRSPALRQLEQRIAVRCHLRPMSRMETGQYLRHRLDLVGGTELQFDDEAVTEIYRHSGGTPRVVNKIGDQALLAGYVCGTRRIDRSLVEVAVREMREAA